MNCKVLTALTTVAFCIVCFSCQKAAPAITVTNNGKERVKVVKLIQEQITPEINSFGTISYYRKADVTVTTDGIISWLGVKEGDPVHINQVIARIDNIQLEIQKKRTLSGINQAKAALELAQAKLREGKQQVESQLIGLVVSELEIAQKKIELDDLDRSLKNKEELFTVGGLSEEAIHTLRMQYKAADNAYKVALKELEMRRIGFRDEDIRSLGLKTPNDKASYLELLKDINTQTLAAEVAVAQASVASAQTELEAINQLLNETIIRAPVSGTIGMRYLEQGERIQANTKLFTVLDLSRVYGVFPIQEEEALSLTTGMTVDLTVDALGKKQYKARIELIAPMVDPQTGNITVKAILQNPGLQLKPGMFVRARVISGAPRATILLTQTCLSRKEGKKAQVFTVVRGRLFVHEVHLGVEKEDRIEILTGLKAGDEVVDSPSPILKEGQEVELAEST